MIDAERDLAAGRADEIGPDQGGPPRGVRALLRVGDRVGVGIVEDADDVPLEGGGQVEPRIAGPPADVVMVRSRAHRSHSPRPNCLRKRAVRQDLPGPVTAAGAGTGLRRSRYLRPTPKIWA
jgi:hypothetical protein